MSTSSPDFLKFVAYLDYPLTSSNMAFLTDLFVNFTQFSTNSQESLEGNFIKWKRFYDTSSYPLTMNSPLLEYINTSVHTNSQTFSTTDVTPQSEYPIIPQPKAEPCDYPIISQTEYVIETSSPSPLQELVPTTNHLPHQLIDIQNNHDCYRNFVLEPVKANMSEHIEVIVSPSPPRSTPVNTNNNNNNFTTKKRQKN
jgi:hypothetical protein